MNKTELYYVVIGYSNPNLKNGSAEVKALCKVPNGVSYWESTALNNRDKWLKFEDRESAEAYIKTNNLECCITYGIRY